MGDSVANYTSEIKFPRQIGLIRNLQSVSFIINDLVLITSTLAILVYLTKFPVIYTLIFEKLRIYPFSAVLFILCGISLLFRAKRHLLDSHRDEEKDNDPWWSTWIPILLSIITAFVGFINIFQLTHAGVLSVFQVSPFIGVCFFLIGLSLIPPHTHIRHRFHITQLLIFLVSGMSMFTVLESLYQLFNTHTVQHIVHVSIPTTVFITFFCFGVFIRWSNRGFFGNFTLDSTVSKLAFRLFLINLILAPLIAFITLFVMQNTPYNLYQVLTVVVALITFTSSLILWLNVRFLYGFELEYLLMRESLRAHNIDLTSEKEVLQKRMTQLEQEKQGYVEKLNIENVLQDVADNSS